MRENKAWIFCIFLISIVVMGAGVRGADNCSEWCKNEGYMDSLEDKCVLIGKCRVATFLPSKSSEICPQPLNGCCCIAKEKEKNLEIINLDLQSRTDPGQALNPRASLKGLDTVETANLSFHFSNPTLVNVFTEKIVANQSEESIKYRIPEDAQTGKWSLKLVIRDGENTDVKTEDFYVGEYIGKDILSFSQAPARYLEKGDLIKVSINSLSPVEGNYIDLKSLKCEFRPEGPSYSLEKESEGTYSEEFKVPENISKENYTFFCHGMTAQEEREANISKKVQVVDKMELKVVNYTKEQNKNKSKLSVKVKATRDDKDLSEVDLSLYVNGKETDAEFDREKGFYTTTYSSENITSFMVEGIDRKGFSDKADWVTLQSEEKVEREEKGFLFGLPLRVYIFAVSAIILFILATSLQVNEE